MTIDRNQSEAFEALDERLLKVPPCEACARTSSLARAVDGFVRCSECRRRLLEEVLKVAAFEVCARCDLSQKRPHFRKGNDDFYHLVADVRKGGIISRDVEEESCPAVNLWKLITEEL